MSVRTQNRDGQWVSAIPLPWFTRWSRKQCLFMGKAHRCDQTFWTTAGYRGHYALTHILGLDR